MNNIIRFWNQNRKGIIAGIVVIVLLVIFTRILNEMAKNKLEEQRNNMQVTEKKEDLPTQSIIGGETVEEDVTKSNVDIIESFIDKCNNGDVTGAYEMLTDECKEALFTTQENFKNGYCNVIFKNKKIAKIENFISSNNRYTYRVILNEDILSTGNASNSSSYQDYITIDENSKTGKINIKSFIYKKDINKEKELEGIKISVLSQEVYKDNEKYQIKIENNTDRKILIDTRKTSKTIYLVGTNNVKYNSNISRLSSTLLEIPSYAYRNYEIGFNKVYSTGIGTNGIVFSDIVTDFEKYKQTPDEVKERLTIGINM